MTINSDISNDYADDTDFSDGGAGNVANPCFSHPADDISPAGNWTDVKVKERDLPSRCSGSSARCCRATTARARVEIRPATSGHRFLPLAVPNNVITNVQVRYYNECDGTLLATTPLYPLGNQGAFASSGGGMLWGLEGGDPRRRRSRTNQSFRLAHHGIQRVVRRLRAGRHGGAPRQPRRTST